LFRQVARYHRDLLDPSLTSWAARSFSAYHSQRISVAVHYSSAAEIVTGRRWAVASICRGMRQGRAERRAARQGRGQRTPAAPVRAQAVCPPVTATTFPTLAAAGSPAPRPRPPAGVAAAGAARSPTTHSHPADSGYGTLMGREVARGVIAAAHATVAACAVAYTAAKNSYLDSYPDRRIAINSYQ